MNYRVNVFIVNRTTIVRKVVFFVLLSLTLSCATKKYQVPTSITEVNSGEELNRKSIELKKGKICYVFHSHDESQLPDFTAFKERRSSNFITSNFSFTPFGGGTAALHTIDTIVSNPLIAQAALTEAITHILPNFEFEIVSLKDFQNKDGELNIGLLTEEHNPDFIINLSDLILKISGDASTGSIVNTNLKHQISQVGDLSPMNIHANYKGNILMDYTANWQIIQVAENQEKDISQNGRYISKYTHSYNIEEEILKSAKKVGLEFSQLLGELK